MRHIRTPLSFLAGFLGMTTILYAIIAFFFPVPSHASLIPICAVTGNCGVCDVVGSGISLGKWLMTAAGGLVLLIIVNASFGLVTSSGNPEKIQESKKQITGAIIGMIITMVAFQLITIVIIIIATPSGLTSYDGAKTEEAGNAGKLKNFLGIAWWDICDQSQLRNKIDTSEKTTANCLYWGDGNACGGNLANIGVGNAVNMCIGGECVDPGSPQVKEQIGKLNRDAKTLITNPCEYLAAIDESYKEYKCLESDKCAPGKTEKNLCPGKTTLCCLPQ